MSEPIKIEPCYKIQGKELVDCLFNKGYFSGTLNRNGMDDVEELLAFFLQSASETAARQAALIKKYKATSKGRQEGEDPERHEEEIRWIARARKAEEWGREACAFLKTAIEVFPNMIEVARLLTDAIKLGIIPEPDCRPGKTRKVRPEDDCTCPPTNPLPGKAVPKTCPKCGGWKI